MKKELNNMSSKELGKLFPIKIVDYDPLWKDYFQNERKYLLKILKPMGIKKIIHFGSTAVPDLPSKPTIDILVEIPKQADVKRKIIEIMVQNGYQHMENHPTHLMFVKGYRENGYDDICYHIHMGNIEEDQLWERIYFKNYLIANPEIAGDYVELKYKLAKKHKYNREAYTKGKTDFIKRITKVAKEKK